MRTVWPMASYSENTDALTNEPQVPQTPASNPSEEAENPQTLERAQVLFHQGSKAIQDGDFVEAVDCLSRALEIRSDLPPFPRPPAPSRSIWSGLACGFSRSIWSGLVCGFLGGYELHF
jgi:hypothetical protein